MQERGFTLFELLITIAIGIILLTIGLPSMRQFIVSNAVEQESNNFFNSIHSARSQAIALNQDVVVCYANTSNTCTTTGYNHLLVFVDKDQNGVLNTGNADPDVILLTGGSISNSIILNASQTNYRFTQDGMLRNNGATLTLYNNDFGCSARRIILSLAGSAQICDNSKAGVYGCPTGNYCQ
nr:GspH/FimT family pseudopilin [uncultured Tolumonas sp.]